MMIVLSIIAAWVIVCLAFLKYYSELQKINEEIDQEVEKLLDEPKAPRQSGA